MKAIFHALVNSVKRHPADKNMDALSLRVKATLEGLEAMAEELENSGYQQAAKFIRAHFMDTFARIAISEGRMIASNAVERLMAEITRRCNLGKVER